MCHKRKGWEMSMKQTTKENLSKLFVGEITLKKRELWLLGAACLLFGVVYGLKKAPLTKGVNVTVGSNNGHNSYNKAEDEDGCECIEVCECDDKDCCCEDEDCCCNDEDCCCEDEENCNDK